MGRPAMAVLATAGVAVLGAGAGPAPAPAAATGGADEHRVAVLVDTGEQVKSVCVRFQEESITGIEALQRAGADPVLRAFTGKGAAVCSLCGTGCPGDGSCLTCDAGGRFWSYSRAAAGTSSLRTSGVGASSTAVRDGDVEGWRWGLGATPAFASVEQVCGQTAPAATSTTATAAPPVTTAPPATTSTTAAPAPVISTTALGRATPPRGELPAAPPTITSTTSTTSVLATAMPSAPAPPASPAGTHASNDLAAGSGPGDDGGSGWAGLAGFAAVVAGLLAWGVAARRRRTPGS